MACLCRQWVPFGVPIKRSQTTLLCLPSRPWSTCVHHCSRNPSITPSPIPTPTPPNQAFLKDELPQLLGIHSGAIDATTAWEQATWHLQSTCAGCDHLAMCRANAVQAGTLEHLPYVSDRDKAFLRRWLQRSNASSQAASSSSSTTTTEIEDLATHITSAFTAAATAATLGPRTRVRLASTLLLGYQTLLPPSSSSATAPLLPGPMLTSISSNTVVVKQQPTLNMVQVQEKGS